MLQLTLYQALRENSQHNVQVRDGLAELFLCLSWQCGGEARMVLHVCVRILNDWT